MFVSHVVLNIVNNLLTVWFAFNSRITADFMTQNTFSTQVTVRPLFTVIFAEQASFCTYVEGCTIWIISFL